ncbi:MAG: nucleotidyltransferase domain-containing protein [Clostridiales bacterium]|jgi:predicted nucleotidyltransferase|nr:nucleotidyltransferase domain-containing protein [Clostridiales bacterium]
MNATELIKGPEYNFLRNNSDLKNIIYLTLSGSRGYGTNNENSDADLRGVLLEDKKYLFGLTSFEQFEDLQTDTVIYGLKKFVRLCAEANPNALELLGTEEDCFAVITEKGKILRENAELFLSARVITSFGNYATAQLRRLQNALCHDSLGEREKLKHLRNALSAQLEHFKRTYTSFDGGAIKIYTDGDVLKFDVNLKNYPINDFIGIYSELSNTVKTYNKLNHRNNKKDDARLFKHAMHLIRLLITGTDILNGKGIITKRNAERNFLMDLRGGNYRFDEIFVLANEYQEKFEKAANATKLPREPDMRRIEELLMRFYAEN